jgi:VWFA-related protein
MKKGMQWVFAIIGLMALGIQWIPAQIKSSSAFKVDVDLVTVEVSAVDKDGKPVAGLKKEDFQVYEDGKKQEIASLDEVTTETGASLEKRPIIVDEQHRGKTVLILFNDNLISPENIKKSRDLAAGFVREHMGLQDLFGVAVFGASMKIAQNMTNDRDKVLGAIAQPAGSNQRGRMYADLYVSLEQINYSLARIKGKKNVLIFLQSNYSNPSKNDPSAIMGYGTYSRPGGSKRVIESAKRANVVYYTIDTVGIASSDVDPKWRTDTLDLLTHDCGGYAIYNTNNVDAELDKLDLTLSNYYILGFQSTNTNHDGTFRRLEIKANIKGMNLKYMPGYQDRSPVDVLASSKQEQTLLSALENPRTVTKLPVAFRPFIFFDTPKSAKVLISFRIQSANIALKKKSGQLSAELNVMGVAYNEDGSVAARFSEPLPVNIDAAYEAAFRKGTLPYINYFKLRPGKYTLKIAVSDESMNIGSAEQSLEIPMLIENGIELSSIVLAEQATPLPELIQNLQTQMLDESDPLVYSGMQIRPSIENKFKVNSTAVVFFRLYSLPNRINADLIAIPKLLDEKGAQVVLNKIPLKKNAVLLGNNMAAVAFNLPLATAGIGKYRLVLEIADSGGARLANAATDLEIMP